MLVYGDVVEPIQARQLQHEVVEHLRATYALARPITRLDALVGAFIAAADLVCALLDREAANIGRDTLTPTADIGTRALVLLAGAVQAAWTSGLLDVTAIEAAGELLVSLPADGTLHLKPIEGYTHYAVYPQSFALAARRSGLPSTTKVIGIRSIGLSLGAMVTAALDATSYVSVRPVGHPFDRRIVVSPGLASRILQGEPSHFAIVDEGPGLSGSSFASVSEWLVAQGVERNRISFFPSHPNDPGSAAGQARLAHWRAAKRHVVTMDDLLLTDSRPLERWLAELLGPLNGPLVDLSWGAWQGRAATSTPAPLATREERRKFLAHTQDGSWLIKFAGLGRWGQHKLRIARHMSQSGHCPHVAGMCHGFMVQRWVEAPALPAVNVPSLRLLQELASYLHRRTELLSPIVGASLKQLSAMVQLNVTEAIGEEAAQSIMRRLEKLPELQDKVRPVLVDSRMHRWEWLVRAGRLIKTDAVDHSISHDFVGPQDIAWDVAGAIVEFGLSERDAAGLCTAFELGSGQQLDRTLLDLMLPCYLAFQLGLWNMVEDSTQAQSYASALALIASAPPDQNSISALTNPSGRSRVASSATPRSSRA